MSQYKTGYVSVTKGSNVVYGYGTSWDGEIDPGDLFSIDGERAIYVVDSVVGSTCLTLTGNYCGSSKTKRTYTITRSFTTNLSLPKVERRDVYWPKYLSYAINILDKGEARGCDPLLDGLVLYFPFHESSLISDSTFYDVSPMGNNGTIYGATWTSEGMSFDGVNDYASRPTMSGLNRSDLTFSFWSKQSGTKSFYMHPIGLFGGHYATVYVDLDSFFYKYKFESIDGTRYEGGISALDDEWHFLAVAFDGSQIKCYVDGALKVAVDAPGSITGGDESLFIGTAGSGSTPESKWFHGLITGVRIYNRALSAEEVNRLYQLGRSYTGLPETGAVYIIDNKLYIKIVDTWHQVTLT